MYIFNYTPYFGRERLSESDTGGRNLNTNAGAWSQFDGAFARQNAYFVRADGSLLCAGAGGKVYIFDQGNYDDDGETFKTEYQTGWLTLDEPKRRVTIKQGNYIKPVVEAGDTIDYTIRAEAGFDADSTDSVIVQASGGANVIGLSEIGKATIGGASVFDRKLPLRWRGPQVRISFTTDDTKGPDTISRFTLYASEHGKR